MASTITALTTGTGGVITSGDASGVLQLKTNNGTTALTLNLDQSATFTGSISSPSITGTQIATNLGAIYPSDQSGSPSSLSGGVFKDIITDIPSWATMITISINGMVCGGTSPFLVQLGTGVTPSYATSGYVGGGFRTAASTTSETTSTAGFTFPHGAATYTVSGLMTIVRTGTFVYTQGFSGYSTVSNAGLGGGGYISLGAAVTGIRITTVDGIQSFSAGTATVAYR